MSQHREWPLVFFTVLTQLAVGVFVLWGVSAVILPAIGSGGIPELDSQPVLIVTLSSLVAGGMAAAFHLGRPAGAFFSLSHLRRSWLSREALFSIGFGVVVALVLVLEIAGLGRTLESAVVFAGVVLGFVLIAAISRLYRLRTVPAWNHGGTPAMFFTTSFLTGASTLMLIFLLTGTEPVQAVEFAGFSNRFIVVLVFLQSAIFVGTSIGLSAKGRTELESVRLLATTLRLPLAARWLFASTGLLLLVFGTLPWLDVVACGLLLVSEVLGRFLFYGVYQRSGF